MPRSYAEWAEAMTAECCHPSLSPTQQLTWAGGCAVAALHLRLRYADLVYFGTALGLIATLFYLDWHTSSDIPVLGLLTVTAAVLGYLRPRRDKWTTLLVGECLLAAHVFTTIVDRWLPYYQCQPPSWTDWFTVASLIVPSGVGVLIGKGIRDLASMIQGD